MKNSKRIQSILAITVILTLAVPWTAFGAVWTDQPEYGRGEEVTIHGDNSDKAGYLGGETVHVEVVGPNGYTSECDGLADNSGTWSCPVTLWDSLLAVGTYWYTATGQTSGVSQSGTFKDALGISSVSPNSGPPSGGTSVTITGTGFSSGQEPVGGFKVTFGGVAATNVTRVDNTHLTATTPAHAAGAVSVAVTDKTPDTVTLPNGFTYGMQDQTITVNPAAPANATYGASFNVAATASSGLAVAITTSGSCTGSGSGSATITMTSGTATCTVNYNQAGNVNYNPAPQVTNTTNAQKANATINVTPYSVAYDSNAHTATGTATGVGGVDLSSLLNLSGTTHTNAGTYNGDPWSFAGNANYNSASGTVNDSIGKANASCAVIGWTGAYDGNAHGASGTCTGVGGVDLSAGLNFGATYTDYPGGTAHWTFTGGTNYNDRSGDVDIVISKADAICSVTGWTGTYDGNVHGASGTCTGVGGVDLSAGLDFGATYTDYPGGTAWWAFSGGTNYNDKSNDVEIVIGKASSAVTVSCPATAQTYTASPQTPCTAEATGVGMDPVNVTALLVYANNTNVGTATADVSWGGDGNHTGNTGSGSFAISKADATCNIIGWNGNYDGASHGASGSCSGIGGESAGTLDLGATFKDVPGGTAHWVFTGNGNYNNQSDDRAIVINSWWTLKGFYQPVDMNGVYNTVKNGSTVPLKFEIFAGQTELTDVSAVQSLKTALVACQTNAVEDAIETVATGGTILRYDSTGGQFIFNWKTPNTAGKCYRVTMTTQDASTLVAYFKLK